MSRLALIPKLLRLSLNTAIRPALPVNNVAPTSRFLVQRFNSSLAALKPEEQGTQEASLEVANLSLCPLLKTSLAKRKISTLFSIQAECFPHIVKGKDLVGRARTGTGKTLAFSLPMIERMQRNPKSDRRRPRVLILAPTRELASQVEKEFFSACWINLQNCLHLWRKPLWASRKRITSRCRCCCWNTRSCPRYDSKRNSQPWKYRIHHSGRSRSYA
ncbi:hypothetical protein DSO57_1003006 [Entomophthora muscae]|uniref:Uncharacterized protein n=1 Tax=Entomophthora muscae TaxID=34485 RepID=A0ACC2SXT1_9FUNG|nr:hypothetical protein DSO57_1003006 [Entomophthora muscae]